MLNNTSIYFGSSSMINETRCLLFTPVDDDQVEDNEPFMFRVNTTNALDTISNGPLFNIVIYDDDGKSKSSIKIFRHYNIFDILGATIDLEPVSNIDENSTMMRQLCINVNTTELERIVVVDVNFDASQSSTYAQSSMLAITLCHSTLCMV